MHTKLGYLGATGLAAIAITMPLALAHEAAQPVSNLVTGLVCYVYTDDTTVEYWEETNNYRGEPSTEAGVGPINHVEETINSIQPIIPENGGSGLQRGDITVDDQVIPADSGPLAFAQWAIDCGA